MRLYHSVHTLTKTTLGQKPQPTLLHPHQWAQRPEKRQEGPRHKGAPRPRPSLLFCAEEWRGPGAAAVGCTGTFETTPPPLSPENKVWSCECAGCRGTREGYMYKTKGTLCQINIELTPPFSPIHPADQQQGSVGVWGRGPKVREEAFKVDVSHISHRTKESQRCTIWTQPHPPLRSHSEKPPCTLPYPATTQLCPPIGCRGVDFNAASQLDGGGGLIVLVLQDL